MKFFWKLDQEKSHELCAPARINEILKDCQHENAEWHARIAGSPNANERNARLSYRNSFPTTESFDFSSAPEKLEIFKNVTVRIDFFTL